MDYASEAVAIIPVPAWVMAGAVVDLDFANQRYYPGYPTGSLGSFMTFTRGSSGYADQMTANGLTLVNFAASNDPRITNLGFLSEPGRTNSLLQSQFAASWSNGHSTTTTNTTAAPDGTITAASLTEDATATVHHQISQSVSKAASATNYIFSCYVKLFGSGSVRGVELDLSNGVGSNGVFATCSLSPPSVINSGTFGSGWTFISAAITTLANGWCRIVLVATSDTDTAIVSYVELASGSNTTYTGDGVSGNYIWGAQLEAQVQYPYATSYIPTTTVAVTRGYDTMQLFGFAERLLRGVAASQFAFVGPAYDLAAHGRFWGSSGALGIAFSTGGSGGSEVYNGTTQLDVFGSGAGVLNISQVPRKAAVAWDATGESLIFQGGISGGGGTYLGNGLETDTNTLPDEGAGNYWIGSANGSAELGGYLQRIAFWNTRLSNSTLIAMVQP